MEQQVPQEPSAKEVPLAESLDFANQPEEADDLSPPQPAPAPAREPVKPTPATPQHPSYLLRQAADLGIPQEDIEAASTDQLGQLVYHLSRQALSRGSTAAPAPVPQPEEVDYDLGLKDEDYDPALLGAMKKLARDHAKQLKEIRAELDGYKQADQQRQTNERYDSINSAIDKLGDARLGQTDALTAGSPEITRRRAIYNEACLLAGEGASLRQQLARLDEARKNLFGDTAPTPTADPPELEQRRKEWAEAPLAHPTQRTAKELPKGIVKAKQTFRAKVREAGLDNDEAVAGAAEQQW